MKYFAEILRWTVLTVIVGASIYENDLAMRFLGAAGVWVGIMNGLAVLLMLMLLASGKVRKDFVEKRDGQSSIMKAYLWAAFPFELVVYAYCGWLWTFGIRVLYQLVARSVSSDEAKEAA